MEHHQKVKKELDEVSKSFCLAKWSQLTLYLQNGYNHSCHYPSPHKIPLREIKRNPKALHNTRYKKQQMKKMLRGDRPNECEYCWKIEDLGNEYFSERIYKSGNSFSQIKKDEILEKGTRDIEPSYLEVSFSNTCNMKCAYCTHSNSTTWLEEIERYGGYPTSQNYNKLDEDKKTYKQTEENPYVNAFWEWWPELYPKLHTLRITGGEPLLSKDTWKVMDELIENPNPNLIFCVNTNLMVPDNLINKLIDKFNQLDGKVKEIQIFTSGESMGSQNEYIRYGLKFEKWQENFEKVLSNVKNVLASCMTAVNILTVPTYCDFVRYLLKLRSIYNKEVDYNKVQFVNNFLIYPEFLSIVNLDKETKDRFKEDVENLIQERTWGKYEDGDGCLTNEQTNQLQGLIEHMYKNTYDEKTTKVHRKDFVKFVNEYDKRRGTDFEGTFKELNNYYKLCQKKVYKTLKR